MRWICLLRTKTHPALWNFGKKNTEQTIWNRPELWSWRILTFCGFCTFCGLCTFWLFMHFFSRTSRITCCKKFNNKYFNWVVFHDVIYNFYSLKDYSEIKRSKSKLKFLSCQGSEWPHPDGTVYRIVRAGPSRQILRQSETVFRPKICCLSQ